MVHFNPDRVGSSYRPHPRPPQHQSWPEGVQGEPAGIPEGYVGYPSFPEGYAGRPAFPEGTFGYPSEGFGGLPPEGYVGYPSFPEGIAGIPAPPPPPPGPPPGPGYRPPHGKTRRGRGQTRPAGQGGSSNLSQLMSLLKSLLGRMRR